jgi:MarR family 2-MHQ and catechol resistance regulon transcriptional repressor
MTNRKKLIEEIMASFHAMRNKMYSHVAQSGSKDCITHSQLFVLAIIEQHRNIGIKEISKKLNISSSAATQLVDGLVENGYVIRKADSKDRRALQLDLSTKGRRHITGLKNKRTKTMVALFDVLNDKELEIYLNLHRKILSKINI